jgi:hypothetical protein
MSTYTIKTPTLPFEALESGFEKLRAASENASGAAETLLMLAGGSVLGLAFVFALPLVCVALTFYYGAKAFAARWTRVARAVKNVTLFFAAPFIGLAYLLALPFVGLGALAYYAVKAARG